MTSKLMDLLPFIGGDIHHWIIVDFSCTRGLLLGLDHAHGLRIPHTIRKRKINADVITLFSLVAMILVTIS